MTNFAIKEYALWMNKILKELREIRYSVRGGVYFLGVVVILGFVALYMK